MNKQSKGSINEDILSVESLMMNHFRTEPFHNFNLLYSECMQQTLLGGTCSDKAISFLNSAKNAGHEAYLHSAVIAGREIHRLVRIAIGRRIFFADVGNGWPSIKLYPVDEEITYHCYGIRFRTELKGTRVFVYREWEGVERLQFEVDVVGRPEAEILLDVEKRFCSGIKYPFEDKARFSMIVGDRFLFLRGDQLEIYGNNQFEVISGIERETLPEVISHYFGCEICPKQRWL